MLNDCMKMNSNMKCIKFDDTKTNNSDNISTSSPEEDELISSLRKWYTKLIAL